MPALQSNINYPFGVPTLLFSWIPGRVFHTSLQLWTLQYPFYTTLRIPPATPPNSIPASSPPLFHSNNVKIFSLFRSDWPVKAAQIHRECSGIRCSFPPFNRGKFYSELFQFTPSFQKWTSSPLGLLVLLSRVASLGLITNLPKMLQKIIFHFRRSFHPFQH